MDNHQLKEKLHLVWGSVFLTAFAGWGLTIVFFSGAINDPDIISIVISMMIGALFSLITVPLLLSVPGSSPALLAGGRILLWIQSLCLVTACVIGVILMVT